MKPMPGKTGYSVIEDASLAGRNTFRVAARTRRLIEVHETAIVSGLFDSAMMEEEPLLVLGAGSNILFTRNWPGTILTIAARGIEVLEDVGDRAVVRVDAGKNWNDFVQFSLDHGWVGLENLALIPGTVGAAPLQNIGAYGVELAEFIHAVLAYDRRKRAMVYLGASECAFAYRDSLFKHESGRYVITAVEFALQRRRELVLDYAGLTEELAAMGVATPTARSVADAIIRLRTRKLPNPAVIGNAGSFFKNPMVEVAKASELRAAYPGLPTWPITQEHVKVSAAWLIERCNFKGLREGDAAVSDQHALVLVNHGTATGADIRALADRVRKSVSDRFGIELEPEPLIV
ncbi:MAG: UDP-N-acetylmuramate dehydrogenase [Rhodanobacteraceae bacterium]